MLDMAFCPSVWRAYCAVAKTSVCLSGNCQARLTLRVQFVGLGRSWTRHSHGIIFHSVNRLVPLQGRVTVCMRGTSVDIWWFQVPFSLDFVIFVFWRRERERERECVCVCVCVLLKINLTVWQVVCVWTIRIPLSLLLQLYFLLTVHSLDFTKFFILIKRVRLYSI